MFALNGFWGNRLGHVGFEVAGYHLVTDCQSDGNQIYVGCAEESVVAQFLIAKMEV